MQETHLKGLHVSTLFIVGFYLFSKKKCCIGGPAIAIVAPQLQEPATKVDHILERNSPKGQVRTRSNHSRNMQIPSNLL